MTFTIQFLSPGSASHGYRRGRIVAPNLDETFESPLSYWSVATYEKQWRMALTTFLAGGPCTALLTSMLDPEKANFLRWWSLHRDGDHAVLGESICFLDQLDRPFVPERIADFVGPREPVDEDGNKISEWRVPLADLREFLARPPSG